jgi:hypothetical protein
MNEILRCLSAEALQRNRINLRQSELTIPHRGVSRQRNSQNNRTAVHAAIRAARYTESLNWCLAITSKSTTLQLHVETSTRVRRDIENEVLRCRDIRAVLERVPVRSRYTGMQNQRAVGDGRRNFHSPVIALDIAVRVTVRNSWGAVVQPRRVGTCARRMSCCSWDGLWNRCQTDATDLDVYARGVEG